MGENLRFREEMITVYLLLWSSSFYILLWFPSYISNLWLVSVASLYVLDFALMRIPTPWNGLEWGLTTLIRWNIMSLCFAVLLHQISSWFSQLHDADTASSSRMMSMTMKSLKNRPSPPPPSDHDDTNQTTFTSSVPPPPFECVDIRKLLSFDQTNHLRTNTQWRSSQMDRRNVTCKRGWKGLIRATTNWA